MPLLINHLCLSRIDENIINDKLSNIWNILFQAWWNNNLISSKIRFYEKKQQFSPVSLHPLNQSSETAVEKRSVNELTSAYVHRNRLQRRVVTPYHRQRLDRPLPTDIDLHDTGTVRHNRDFERVYCTESKSNQPARAKRHSSSARVEFVYRTQPLERAVHSITTHNPIKTHFTTTC